MIKECERCHRQKEILAKNKCASCYSYVMRDVDKVRQRNKDWQSKHLDYWRSYYAKNKEVKNE